MAEPGFSIPITTGDIVRYVHRQTYGEPKNSIFQLLVSQNKFLRCYIEHFFSIIIVRTSVTFLCNNDPLIIKVKVSKIDEYQ